MEYNLSFANWREIVRVKLIRRGMTIKELAAAIGYNDKYMYNVLNQSAASQVAVNKVSEYLQVPVYQYSEIDRREIRTRRG